MQAFTWLSQHPYGAQSFTTHLLVFFSCVRGGERVSIPYPDPNVLNETKQGEWQFGISVVQSIHFHSAMVLSVRSHFIIVAAENKHL